MKTTLKTTIIASILAISTSLAQAHTNSHQKIIATQNIIVKDFTGSYVGNRNFATLEDLDNKTFLTIAANKVKSAEEITKVVNICADVTTCHIKARVLKVPVNNSNQYDYFLIEALEVNKVE